MLAEYLKQAAALELILDGKSSVQPPIGEVVDATLNCAEGLWLGGEADQVLRMLEWLKKEPLFTHQALRRTVLELRALATLHRDHECLECARACIHEYEAKGFDENLSMVRVMEG